MKQLIVGLGETLWDYLPEGRKLGGAPTNFAYYTGQLGYDSLTISAIENDVLDKETLDEFGRRGIKYLIPEVDYQMGTVQVEPDSEGIPTYGIKEGVAWDNIPFTPEIEGATKSCRAVCLGSLAQRNSVSRQTIQKFLEAVPKDCLKVFDINLHQNFYTKEIITNSFQHANIPKINDEKLVLIGRLFGYLGLDIKNKCWLLLGKYHLDMPVLTCGVNSSCVFVPNFKSFQETPAVEVADTVGAGDSFTGAFISAILAGIPITDAHKLVVEVSAYVYTQNGTMPKLPKELLDRIK